jgi:signal transduction histidine kinase
MVLALSSLVAVGGAAVLCGWVVDSAVLRSGVPGLTAMNPLTAILFVLAAIALALSVFEQKPAAAARRGLPILIAIVALSCLVNCLTQSPGGVDTLLFGAWTGEENRMAPNTAIHFLLAALALSLAQGEHRWSRAWSQVPALAAAIGSATSLVGYAYGAQQLYGIGSYIPMALNTAVLFFLLSIGLFAARLRDSVFFVLSSDDAGGLIARRLLPAAIIVPFVLGWFRIAGERAGLYDSAFGAALMVIVTVALLAGAILVTAIALSRADAERQKGQAAILLYADIVRHIPIGLTIWRLDDSANDRSLRLVSANAAASGLLGIEVSSWIGKTILEAFPAIPPAHLAIYADVVRSGQCREIPVLHYGDERVRASAWSVKAFPLPDHCVGLAFENVSARIEAEQRIRSLNEDLERRVAERTSELAAANRDLQQKNQENEMFVYSVSHDLRSPLVSLQGFSKELTVVGQELRTLLADEGVPATVRVQAERLITGDMQQALKFIQSGVLRLSNIIDALLRLSRVGRVEYDLRPQETHQIVARVVESMASELFDREVVVEVGPLPRCCADATALEQLFANLIGNALKFLDNSRKGQIEVGAVSEQGDLEPADRNGITFFVRDNGLGISPAHHEKIFQAFQRVHPKHAPGEGMGLAFVRRMVERHGGRVWVESVVGQGSTFFFTLPSREPAACAAVPNSKERGPTNAERADGHLVGGRR